MTPPYSPSGWGPAAGLTAVVSALAGPTRSRSRTRPRARRIQRSYEAPRTEANSCRLRGMRQVRGVLFLDYVKMVRSFKSPTMSTYLDDAERAYIAQKVEPDAWYPMAVFERLGCAILATVARGELFPVQ